MFPVIHFTTSDEIVVVPFTWVENNTAFLPIFKSTSKVIAAIRSKAAHSKDWEQFLCRVLSTTGMLCHECRAYLSYPRKSKLLI